MKSSWNALLKQVSAVGDCLNDHEELGKQLKQLDQVTRALVFYDDRLPPNEHLVHYTSWEQALAILKGKGKGKAMSMLRHYSFERTNDPQEGRLWRKAWDGMTENVKPIDKRLPSYDQTLIRSGRSTGSTFGCCFSTGRQRVEDDLTFWRLYGNDGNGCSFKLSSLPPNTYRVRYLDEQRESRHDDRELDQRVGSRLRDLLTRGDKLINQFLPDRTDIARWIAGKIRTVLDGYNHLAKSSYFEDENEWRMVDVDPPTESILYDVDEASGVVRRYVAGLSLKDCLITGSSITVGPQVPNGAAARAYVEYLVRKYLVRKNEPDVPPRAGGSHDRWPVVNLSKLTYRSAR